MRKQLMGFALRAAGLAVLLKRHGWTAQTSSEPNAWSPENPSWGQCAVTACVVQDHLGGDIVWAEAQLPDGSRISHYFNRVNGEEVDLTREQFPQGTVVPPGVDKKRGFGSTREYVLSFEATRQRYALLAERLGAHLART